MKERRELVDRMIRLLGFEHPVTVSIARLEERGLSTETLRNLVEGYETMGIAFEFEEEEDGE